MSPTAGNTFWKDQEEIVISGVSGRFPRCENVEEFGDRLLAGEDLVTEDSLRWPPGLYDLPKRHGKIAELKKFDAQFFSVPGKQANFMDPQVRMLLEVTWEALVDAGINPVDLRGTRTGVFVGCSHSEMHDRITSDPDTVSGYGLSGCTRSMFSNRISFTFDFRGPSFSVDTACSSSLLALQLAMDAIRLGDCDSAIVAGAHLTLSPTTALQFRRLNMLSDKGSCRSFDESGDGYCRTEGIAAIYIQRADVAKRLYATVIHAKSSTDGNKAQGITYPSGDRQAMLIEQVYAEAGVDPNSVYYVEAHGTGTSVGDPQEANSIDRVFCSNRPTDRPLLIGSVKSNMGHAEPASGVCSLAKLMLSINRGMIPPNLHYNKPNPNIPGLVEGRLKVVTEPTPLNGGIIAINSFGFGGSNTHAVLRVACHETAKSKDATFTRLVTYSGRTKESIQHIFEKAQQHKDNAHFLALLANQANLPTKDTPFRGWMLLNNDVPSDVQKVAITESRPIYFIYSGMGSQWPGMAQKLMVIPAFDQSLRASSACLDEYGIDVYGMLCSSDAAQYNNNPHNCILAITTIQIALTDVLELMGVRPDGIIGHSTGEMGCGYADRAITREETMKLAYQRGLAIMAMKGKAQGSMAAVGMTWAELEEQLPEGVVPACHNGADSVTISGDTEKVAAFCEAVSAKGVFAKVVDSSGMSFHSPKMALGRVEMLAAMKSVLPQPRKRSEKWISTSIKEEDWGSDLAATCSAEYHVHNFCSPVLFHEAIQKIPENAVTIELAPHALMQAVLRRSLPTTVAKVGMMNLKAENELDSFLQAIGKIYQAGVEVHVEKLYPTVEYPVPNGTPMIGPMWKWDHSQDFPVVDCSKDSSRGGGVAASASYAIDAFAADSKEAYLVDHCIDGRVLYPFTGYMVLAWRTLCKLKGLDYRKTPVVFENVNVYAATIMTKAIKLDVVITPGSNQFDLLFEDQVTASGTIYIPEEGQRFYYDNLDAVPASSSTTVVENSELDSAEAYKEFLLRGYEYGPNFRGIHTMCNSGERGELRWTGNWVTFLDTILQASLLTEKADTLKLPTRIRYLRVDPEKHQTAVIEKDGFEVIKLVNDIATNGCVAGGVECCDVIAHTVARRMAMQGQLYHEKIHFVPHFDDHALADFPKEKKALEEYTTVLKQVIARGLSGLKTKGLLAALPNAAVLEKALADLAPFVTAPIDEAAHKRFSEDNKCFVLKAFEEVFAISTANQTPQEFAVTVSNHIKAVKTIFETDRMWAAALVHDRMIKTIQDVAIENSSGHNHVFAGLELNSVEQLKWLNEAVSSHPLLEVDWVCVGPSVEHLDEMTLEQLGSRKIKVDLDKADFAGHAEAKNFDCLVLDKVLARKSDPIAYLTGLKHLMRDDGFIVVVETVKNHSLNAAVQAFMVDQLAVAPARAFSTYYSDTQLRELFEKAGFRLCNYQADTAASTTVYLIRKTPEKVREPVFVDVDDVKEFSWIEPLQKIVEDRASEPENKTIWLTSTKVRNNGVVGMGLCFNEENLKKKRFRTIVDMSTDPAVRNGPSTIKMDSEDVKKMIELDQHANNYKDGVWGSMRHLVVKDEDKAQYKPCEHAFINTLVRGDVSSLTWFESPNQYFNDFPNKKANAELCHVYYSAINFRDVMLAYGRLPPDAIPGQFADRECLLGMEFAGRLNDGSRWMGILPAQALATSVVIDRDYAWQIPASWSLADAATVPVVYTTAYYALILRGQMRRGESVLIHGGSGGVGQAAIAIALSMGCEVYTTVGSKDKRDFLKKKFPQLKDHNFANSRSTEFELHIRHMTKGKGVDLVLNSLAQEMLQASVRCLAVRGRFLEIGKVDLSQNSALGMAVFLKNVTFHGVLLDTLMDPEIGDAQDWKSVVDMLKEGIKSGVVQPLPYSAFPADKAEDAFRFMSAGKHIGKVLMEIRGEEEQKMCVPTPITVRAICRTLCHPQHVYLITGGLGGFGLELAQWLVTRGARKLVLTSRSGVRTGYQARCVAHWRKNGVQVLVSTQNIAKAEGANALISECTGMGPLGGVFHLAMILRDCLFENQSVQNFKDAAEAKYDGTLNLDAATRKAGDALRWFVCFSSIVSGRGNGGQTNYGWANCTMERMVEARRRDGHPGIAIQWGAIGDVGVILEHMGDNNTVIGGTLPQRMPSCLSALDLFLSWNHPIVSSYIKAECGEKKKAGGGNFMQTIAHILGVSDIAQLNPDANLGDLGLDSLMGVEIKQALERDFDIVVSMKDIRTLTLKKLQAVAESGGAGTSLQSSELELKKESERDAAQNSAEHLEQQLNQFFKMRVDVNDLDPQEIIVKGNDVKEGPITFFAHPVEGIATPLKRVMQGCNFPAYCFQMTKDVPQDSIESVARRYIEEMKKIQKTGPYRLVGYSYGACIVFEMACMLQKTGDVIERLILLDGSHLFMKTYTKTFRKAFGVSGESLVNNPLAESEVMAMMAIRFANVDYKKFRGELIQLSGLKARVQMVVDTVMPAGLFKNPATIAVACEAMLSKCLMADKYNPTSKFAGKITLVRALHGSAREEDVGQDYGVGAVSDEHQVFVVDGDHDTLVQGEPSAQTVGIINHLVAESNKA